MRIELIAPCHFGLEAVLKREILELGYEIAEVEDGKVTTVRTLPPIPHQQGGCLAPVNYLAGEGVNVLLAGGMGMRPLMGFNQAGVEVYYAGNFPTVGQSVQAFIEGRLPAFTPEHSCGGH